MEDHFDDSLESAILTYQNFFKLNKTGVLDYATVSMMSKPRCGVPDIYNLEKPHESETHQSKDQERFHFPIRYAFFEGNPHRMKSELFVQFAPDITIPFRDAIKQAFSDWEPYVPLKFIYDRLDVPFDIKVEFFRGAHYDGAFDGPEGVVAHASPGVGSNFHFDVEENWEINPGRGGGLDVATVARHEIGHLLGLAHCTDDAAIMWPYTAKGSVKLISYNDKDGIKILYSS